MIVSLIESSPPKGPSLGQSSEQPSLHREMLRGAKKINIE